MSRAQQGGKGRRGRREAQVVVVTGASSGIGREVALRLAGRGDRVVLAARTASSLEEVADACRRRGAEALVVPTDVADEAAVAELARRAVDAFGRIDVWVGAAATWSYGRFEDTPADTFAAVLGTTLLGQVHGARAVLPVFRAQGRGTLVCVSSLYGRLTSPYVAPYVTAKWGLQGFTEVLRQELRDAPGIAVCTVLPGTVDTPVYRHAANHTGRDIRPLPPVVSAGRVAAAVLRVIDRPRRQVVVGRTLQSAVPLHALAPRLYDAAVVPLTRVVTLRRTRVAPHDGTVFAPDAASNRVADGWRRHDARLLAGVTLAVSASGALAAAARGALRRRGGPVSPS